MSSAQGGFLEDLPDDILGADPVADVLGALAAPEGPQAVDLAAWPSLGRASVSEDEVAAVVACHRTELQQLVAWGTPPPALPCPKSEIILRASVARHAQRARTEKD